jgi:hypothetical protein
MSTALIIFLALGLLLQSLRVRQLRRLLWPPKSCNVIRGIVYPSPDDVRWKRTSAKENVSYYLNDITVRMKAPDVWFYTFAVEIEGFSTRGFAVKRYWKAIDQAYLQRQALSSIEKEPPNTEFDKVIHQLDEQARADARSSSGFPTKK